MLLFLLGKDTYLARQKLDEIVARFLQLPKAKRSLRVIDCAQEDFGQVEQEIQTSSLFGERKLLVLKNACSLAHVFIEAKDLLTKSPHTIVFFEQKEVEPANPLLLFLKEHAKTQGFKPLGRAATLAFTKKEFQRYGKQIEQDALFVLCQETGDDLWRLSEEVKKLVAYLGKREVVQRRDVQELLHPSVALDANIFSTLDAILLGQRQKALALLCAHLKKGDEPLYILSMVAMHLRRALEAKDLKERSVSPQSIAKTLSLHPWAAKKLFEVLQGFSQEKLFWSFEKVVEMDRDIKTGLLEPAGSLYSFVAMVETA